MPSPKEKSSGKKPKPSAKPGRSAMPKRMLMRGSDEALDRTRAQFRDAAPSESTEEYGGEQIERSASQVADRAVCAAGDVGSRIKDRTSEQLRSRRADERIREAPNPQADAAPTQESYGSEATSAPAQEPDIRQRPEIKSENAIKTKENYIHAQVGEDAGTVREKPQRRPAVDRAEGIRTQEKAAPGDAPAYTETPAYRSGKENAQAQAQSRIKTREVYRRSSQQVAADAGKGTIKTASKGTVKTVNTSVKTAERTVKTADAAAKTAKATAKTAQKTTETAAKTAKAAAQTAEKTAKVAVKAAASAIKAIIAALKGLIAAIVAGGWVAVVVIAGIALVGLLLCTAFGVFMADETEDGSKPMSEAVYQIDTEFRSEIDARIAELSIGEYDEVVVDYMGDIDGDSAYVNNWNDVLATYAVLLTEDEVFRLNGRGAFYYKGGEDGIYIRIRKDGLVEAGTYSGAIPHIGEAIFHVKGQKQCADYAEAFKQAIEMAGKSFFVDMFSGTLPAPLAQAEKPRANIHADQTAVKQKRRSHLER